MNMKNHSKSQGAKCLEQFITENQLDFPGIYRMINFKMEVLYIGKAKNLKNRLRSYCNVSKLHERTQQMVMQISHVEVLKTKNEQEALILEASLIKSLKPKYNILLKDDKSYPYIIVPKDHDFPPLKKFRGQKDVNKAIFYGPFASAKDVDMLLEILHSAFKLRNCSDSYFANRSRPCLQYQINKCSAPCVGKVTKDEYAQQLKMLDQFMNGKSKEIQKQLIKKMENYSSKLNYEKAAEVRDEINIISKMQAKNGAFQNLGSTDVVVYEQHQNMTAIYLFFFRNGFSFGHKEFFPEQDENISPNEAFTQFLMIYYKDRENIPAQILVNKEPADKMLLEQIIKSKILTPTKGPEKEVLDFALDNVNRSLVQRIKKSNTQQTMLENIGKLLGIKLIKLIEVYDNSHIFGSHATGAMIAVGEQGFCKDRYRKFNIRESHVGDDLAMMKEVLTRRIKKLLEGSENYPDLMIIDGGQTQLGIAIQVLSELGVKDRIRIISIAKGEFRNKGNETIFTDHGEVIKLENNDDRMKFLQILRDEVHGFAIRTYRAKHIKSMTRTELLNIPGIGQKKSKNLFSYFGSVENIKNASLDELSKVDLIDYKTAKKIFTYFNS
jgi:excinuclease ABC subunit C